MKFVITIVVIAICFALFSFSKNSKKQSDCQMVVTYAGMTFANFKKAYQADSLNNTLPFIMKGVE